MLKSFAKTAGIASTIPNALRLGLALYPLFIICFVTTAALFNGEPLKGMAFVGWIIFLYIWCKLIGRFFGSILTVPSPSRMKGFACNIFYSLGDLNKVLPTKVAISFFTLVYLVLPAVISGRGVKYILVPLIYLTLFAIIYGFWIFKSGCATDLGVVVAGIIGSSWALVALGIVYGTGGQDLLFYNELVSNNAVCKLDTTNLFRCRTGSDGAITMQP